MITITGFEGQRVAVLGLGRTGLATCRALAAGGAQVLAWDEDATVRSLTDSRQVALTDLTKLADWSGVSVLIVSPGIPHLYPNANAIVESALGAGCPIDNDLGLLFRSIDIDQFGGSRPIVVAVTGSNGKSTTSALVHHVLISAGKHSQLAGNIGDAALGMKPFPQHSHAVLEVSSYQAEVASCLEPNIAVFLNFTPDHLERHGGMGGYFSAKRRLFEGERLGHAIICVDQAEGRMLAGSLRRRMGAQRVVSLSSRNQVKSPFSVLCESGRIAEMRAGREVGSVECSDAPNLSGPHNLQNAGAALAVCRLAGLSLEQIQIGLNSFAGLPHRSQMIGDFGGVRIINDSKATNAESAAMALRTYRNIHWIAGGLAKAGGISGIVCELKDVKRAYLIGSSAQDFARQIGAVPFTICGTMENAVEKALKNANPGDTILLSPAAASFDQYADFEMRGDHFADEVFRWCLSEE